MIIAYAGDLDSVTTQIAKASRKPALIPVIDRNATNDNWILIQPRSDLGA